MKSSSSLPKHLYLVRTPASQHLHKPSPETMGAKGYNLHRMTEAGLNVPVALVIGTHYTHAPQDCFLPVFSVGLHALEESTGLLFGDDRNPLILSVRSGAPVSMPGMLETLLNIGLSDHTLPGLVRQTGNPRMAWDAYRRLVASYGEVVAGLPASLFEAEITRVTQGQDERLLDFSQLRQLTRSFLALYETHAGRPFPQDAQEQLSGAIAAVFASWNADKAAEYRRINQIDADMGTAVILQRMVFGNTGGHSGAGVGFTRDPSTGEPRLWVDFLANAQGEDVVSGRRNAHGHATLAAVAPEAWKQLQASAQALEQHFQDMEDFEFTVQDGVLHMLQTRSGKRTPLAAARIALDLLDEGLIDSAEALHRTQAIDAAALGTVRMVASDDPDNAPAPLAQANPACSGVVSGAIALDAQAVERLAQQGLPAILVRQDAETSDIAAMQGAQGLLTQRGARTSHAAVVARQMGKTCLVGCTALHIDEAARTVQIGSQTLAENEVITLDGNDGAIYAGQATSALVPDTALRARLEELRSQHHGKGARHHKH
ncbi:MULTISPECIES: PEP/pyruvate-binding domain-containing protein [unclassified Acidovorax]|jgi:pyruvate,orthophosphate dikinase|uniref:PEP/pyruvate-binding domain-containing protein n=1 Tax=unclassified Acidovorax TaxID=2684926 RepID=UPI0025BD7CB0|nr:MULTISPECIES: PEP/pyruvate-binding domain-containing protein [unclassified Acidovorax]HQS22585.1 PEP/pyruvate-binding domain-containing protein [Acidovorax defluvii]HQS64865.1 PEP/pyruvate-binding domain-containing protein [Acidovorax defluvii]HQT18895.1 PEP/pyruvate-binding domain-containing protein [Acidovorax defluvii]HQT51628.1 PEP/pyruvate-binding domain-containing protein [Acidovorax defluvii]